MAIPLAAPDDEDELERLVLSFSPRFRELLDERAESIKREGGILHDEFWKTVEAGYHRPAEDSA